MCRGRQPLLSNPTLSTYELSDFVRGRTGRWGWVMDEVRVPGGSDGVLVQVCLWGKLEPGRPQVSTSWLFPPPLQACLHDCSSHIGLSHENTL